MVIVETERLILRQFEERDIPTIFLLNSNPEVLTYIPGAPMTSIAQAEDIFTEVILASYDEYGYGRWAVENKQDNKVIGFCGPKYITEFDEVEIGYRYLPEYWGKGYGSEAGSAALEQFQSFGVTEAIAIILLGNKGSEGLAQKLGMQFRNRDSFVGHKVNVYHKDLAGK